MPGPRHGALALGALLLSGASAAGLSAVAGRRQAGLTVFRGPIARRPPPPLPVHGTLPDFSLIDDRRQPISRSTLQGSVWIADFIFTRCAGQCPFLGTQMAALQRFFRDVPKIRLVSFSVEPWADTPEALAAYASRYRGPGGRWQFVTGEPSAMTALIQDGFRLAVGREGSVEEPIPPPAASPSATARPTAERAAPRRAAGGGTIAHSLRFVLVDPQGAIRGYYDAADPQAMARLREDAKRLAR